MQAFFKWLVEEGEIRESPMARMKPPKVDEVPPPLLSDSEVRALLATCEKGQDFEDRRDYAILRVLIDTGGRRAEIAALRYTPQDDETNDVDIDRSFLRVYGKGGRWRFLPLGNKAVKALDRYLRLRPRHPAADTPWLWLGHKGRLADSGIAQMLRRRSREAGLGDKVHGRVIAPSPHSLEPPLFPGRFTSLGRPPEYPGRLPAFLLVARPSCRSSVFGGRCPTRRTSCPRGALECRSGSASGHTRAEGSPWVAIGARQDSPFGT